LFGGSFNFPTIKPSIVCVGKSSLEEPKYEGRILILAFSETSANAMFGARFLKDLREAS